MDHSATRQPNSVRAFTLIELSIALVIIGLLVGGVLVGKDMVEAAKLRSVNSDIQAIIGAANTFKVKYNCLPGDCKNATQFFGGAPCIQPWSNPSVAPSNVCNGNGDGVVGDVSNPYPKWENFYFWRTLQRADLYNSQITQYGMPCSGYCCSQGTSGMQTARGNFSTDSLIFIADLQGSTPNNCFTHKFSPLYAKPWAWNMIVMPGDYTHAIVYAKTGSFLFHSGAGDFTANQLAALDTKFDDGMSNTGRIMPVADQISYCAPTTSAVPTRYINSNATGCGLVYLRAF